VLIVTHEASLHNKGKVGLNSIQRRILCISTNIHTQRPRERKGAVPSAFKEKIKKYSLLRALGTRLVKFVKGRFVRMFS